MPNLKNTLSSHFKASRAQNRDFYVFDFVRPIAQKYLENGPNTQKKVSSWIFSLSNAAKQSPLAIFPAEIWPKQIFAPKNSLKISFWRFRALRKSKWPETCFFGRDGPKYTHIGKN